MSMSVGRSQRLVAGGSSMWAVFYAANGPDRRSRCGLVPHAKVWFGIPGGQRLGGRPGRLGQPSRRRRLRELGALRWGTASSTRWGIAIGPLASLLGDARTATACC
jgi:hypothetical protein